MEHLFKNIEHLWNSVNLLAFGISEIRVALQLDTANISGYLVLPVNTGLQHFWWTEMKKYTAKFLRSTLPWNG